MNRSLRSRLHRREFGNRHLDRGLAFHARRNLALLQLGKEFLRRWPKSHAMRVADYTRHHRMVDQIARVVRRVCPPCACTRISKSRLAGPRIPTQEDTNSL